MKNLSAFSLKLNVKKMLIVKSIIIALINILLRFKVTPIEKSNRNFALICKNFSVITFMKEPELRENHTSSYKNLNYMLMTCKLINIKNTEQKSKNILILFLYLYLIFRNILIFPNAQNKCLLPIY